MVYDRSLHYAEPLDLETSDKAALLHQRGGKPVTYVEPPKIERSFFRYPPEFQDDPDNTKILDRIEGAVYKSFSPFMTVATEASLVGYRTIITGDQFFNDCSYGLDSESYFRRLESTDSFHNEDTRLRRLVGKTFRLENCGLTSRHIEHDVVSLCSHEPSNYGSFLFRVVPKILAIRELGLGHLPVLVWCQHKAQRDLLELLGFPQERIIHHDTNIITTCDRVFVPSCRNPNAFLDYQSRTLFAEIVHRYGVPRQPGLRLYISRLNHSRKGNSSRVMLNEAVLIETLARMGFRIIQPETLTVRQQIELFSSADIIVGPSGGAMFNVVFCRPGTKIIDIESEPDWIYAHTGLFASSQLRYGIFTGKVDALASSTVHKPWSVNIEALVARINDF